jgi:hypothetical protein
MRNIKSRTFAFLFSIILVLAGNANIKAQNIDSKEIDDESIVYWFYVNLRIHVDTKTGYENYIVKRLGTQIYHGSINDYDRELWKSLGNGSKMAIGPFYNFDEAQQGLTFYDFTKEERVLSDVVDKNKELFFFVLRVEKRKRSGAYLLRRIPGAIANGDAKSFDDMLVEGLDQKRLAIGPFWNSAEAEEAKRRYRLSGKDN